VALLGAAVVVGAGFAVMARPDGPATADVVEVPRFVEETADSGIAHAYDGDFTYFVGGGVAVFDCDEDGRPEL
jgi:hypothetical protein